MKFPTALIGYDLGRKKGLSVHLVMHLGVSTWLWTSPFSSKDTSLFHKIAEIGFTHVEIPIEDPNLIDGDLVARGLRASGLRAIACGAFGASRDLTSEDQQSHHRTFAYLHACFKLCLQWECSFLAGPMYSAVGKARLVPPEVRKREWDRAVQNLTKACEIAQGYGVRIALEPINRFETDLVNTADQVMKLIHEIDHPAAGVLLASFHMTLEENSLSQAIETVGDRLLHVQVSENQRGVPGSGQTNWSEFRDALMAINYQGAVSIESFTPRVQELADAVCIWRSFAESQDKFAEDGFYFLNQLFNS